MRAVPQFEELKDKYQRKQPLYPGHTVRDVEPCARAAAGRDVDDHRPKAWLELAHPETVLVAGLLSPEGGGWLLRHVLQQDVETKRDTAPMPDRPIHAPRAAKAPHGG